MGYKAIQTYYNAKQWKTNAPPEVLYDLFKAFKIHLNKDDPSKILANLNEGTTGWRIFQKPIENKDISFDYKAELKAAIE